MTSENFDIYGDLDEALTEPLQEEVQKRRAENFEKAEDDRRFREATEQTIKELERSNAQLKKNMSILLATARAEIER
jgi:hypothetical protein